MTQSHWSVLFIYLGFLLVATLLTPARRWLRPERGGESVWRKYPTYILINFTFLAASWLPQTWHLLTLLLALLGGLAAGEITRALLPGARLFFPWLTAGLVAAGAFGPEHWYALWLAVLLLLLAAGMLVVQRDQAGRWLLAMAGCGVYLPVCLAAYLWILRADPFGFRAVFLYLTISTNDALAQITGQLAGRRSLAPRLSPSKTVEGALGGVFFAGLMGTALSSTLGWHWLAGAVVGLALGLAGLLGDLTASAWKRALGLRNFSGLLGAQGGVLDRFDSLIFAAPVFYVLTLWWRW